MQSGASTGSADDDDNEGRVDRARFDSGSDAVVDPDVCVGADGKVAGAAADESVAGLVVLAEEDLFVAEVFLAVKMAATVAVAAVVVVVVGATEVGAAMARTVAVEVELAVVVSVADSGVEVEVGVNLVLLDRYGEDGV